MAKLPSRTALTAPSLGDLLHIVDISDTSSSPDGTSKKIAYENLVAPTGISFTSQTSVTVTHNLGYKPKGITVLDGSGNEILVSIEHINTSSFVMTSNTAISGTIIY